MFTPSLPPFLQALSLISVALAASVPRTIPHTTRHCFASNLCFETFSTDDLSVGFILPPHGNNDFIVNVTTPIQYGFAGVAPPGFNDSSSINVLLAFIEVQEEGGVIVPLSEAVLQMSNSLPNNTLAPTTSSPTMTLSSLSQLGPSKASYTLRCQNCNLFPPTSSSSLRLQTIESDTRPIYLDEARTRAILPLEGSDVTNFDLNLGRARVSQATYGEYLRTAGFS